MKKLILLPLLFLSLSVASMEFDKTPFEKDANITEDLTENQVNGFAMIIRLNGYKCDSISSAYYFVFSDKYNINCNQLRYSYDIKDHGGRPVVTVID